MLFKCKTHLKKDNMIKFDMQLVTWRICFLMSIILLTQQLFLHPSLFSHSYDYISFYVNLFLMLTKRKRKGRNKEEWSSDNFKKFGFWINFETFSLLVLKFWTFQFLSLSFYWNFCLFHRNILGFDFNKLIIICLVLKFCYVILCRLTLIS